MHELIDPKLLATIPEEHKANLYLLHYRVNQLRRLVNLPFVIRREPDRMNSGYRTQEMHYNLYERLSRGRAAPLRIPTQSWHLFGAAADILDTDGKIAEWVTRAENLKHLERLDLYFEDPMFTHGWVHVQIYAPASGDRFFRP